MPVVRDVAAAAGADKRRDVRGLVRLPQCVEADADDGLGRQRGANGC